MRSARGIEDRCWHRGRPILLPIALNRTTMKVLLGIQTCNLLKSEKSSAMERLTRLLAQWAMRLLHLCHAWREMASQTQNGHAGLEHSQ
jgi:hypothetical protein